VLPLRVSITQTAPQKSACYKGVSHQYGCFPMTKNFRHKIYFPFLLLMSSLVMVSFISCTEQNQEEAAAPSESSPEYAKEVAAPSESYPEYGEEVAAPPASYPEYAEEVAPPPASYPEYGEEADALLESYIEYGEEAAAPAESYPEYTVVLGVDEQLGIPGFPGELRVWIGNSNFKPNFPTSMIQDETTIPGEGESAKVVPFAPAFEIDPPEIQCIKIHLRGSELRFKLIPKKAGTFNVGANVFLFDSLDCSGSPIPKIAATLQVMVEVNTKEILAAKAGEIWSIFWEKLLEFWAAFVVLIFGLILFLIRSKLKQWFGFEDK
jgi:hypothetical protein